MLNQIILVGRLVREPELKSSENNKKYMVITLAIPRAFKNSNGDYDTDYIDCMLWDLTAKTTSEYCHKGDIVGIKGRIQSRVVEQDSTKRYYTDIIAEKVTFLSSRKGE